MSLPQANPEQDPPTMTDVTFTARSVRIAQPLSINELAMNQENKPKFETAFLHPKYWPLWLGFGLLWLITLLPFRWQLGIGRGLGLLAFKYAGSRRKVARRNLELCFPEKTPEERQQMLKENKGVGILA